MKNLCRALLCAAAAIYLTAPVAARTTADGGAFPSVDSVVLTLMRRYGLPAASIAVVRDGRMAYKAAYGEKDTVSHKKARTHNRYRIASLSDPARL